MTWEEAILCAREKEEHKELIKQCYLTDDLTWNIEEYGRSDEFSEILKIIKEYAPHAKSIVEFGAGNGIASVNFALLGFEVLSSEPDKSSIVGTGAIRQSILNFNVKNINVIESYAETLEEKDGCFDVVFARQCMHHANDLGNFTKNAYRLLKPGGLFLTVRDHVINSEANRQEFLKLHPLHKYYGGENAFSQGEYERALINAGFKINKVLRYFDSVINFSPEKEPLQTIVKQRNDLMKKKFPKMSKFAITRFILLTVFSLKHGKPDNDKNITGRMYSFIATR